MRRFLVAVFVCCLATPALIAQSSRSSITGTVRDVSGNALPGVSVQLNSLPFSRTTTTDESGQFAFRDLPAIPYSIVFSQTGFTTVERVGYRLFSGYNARMDCEMKAGTGTETIGTVTDATIEGRHAVTATVVGNHIVGLPVLVAQPSSSSISGTVRDAAGNPLTGASVQLNSLPFSRIMVADRFGQYAFRNLPAGSYSIVYSLTGFTSEERTAFQLLSDTGANVDVQLQAGTIADR